MNAYIIFAQIGGYGLAQVAIWLVVAAGIVGIVLIAAQATGVAIPGWVRQVAWVVLAVVICVVAIRFIASVG